MLDVLMAASLLEVNSLGLQPCLTSAPLERRVMNEVAEVKETF